MGGCHDGSDLDLVLRGTRARRRFRLGQLAEFEDAIRESNDSVFGRGKRLGAPAPSCLIREIERDYVVPGGKTRVNRWKKKARLRLVEWRQRCLRASVDGRSRSNPPAYPSYRGTKAYPVIRGANLAVGHDCGLAHDMPIRLRSSSEFRGGGVQVSEWRHSVSARIDTIFTKKGTLGQTGLIPDTMLLI